jgi:glutathione-regulated potassium-efflux system ancillary protein KefG
MNKILLLFAHPLFEKSRIHTALLKAIPESENITVQDLYELYPDFNINVDAEKKLLSEHDIIIWQHPLYWYSVPPLLKQWIDMVLQYGWAYGPGGEALRGKIAFNAISSGGQEHVYSSEARNRYTIKEFLAPIEQTATLCHLTYLPPFIIHGTHLLDHDQIDEFAADYKNLLFHSMNTPFDIEACKKMKYLNEMKSEMSDKS